MFGRDTVRKLTQACPNFEQLCVGLEDMDLKLLRLLISFAPKLSAFRILINPLDPVWETLRSTDDSLHARMMSYELWRSESRTSDGQDLETVSLSAEKSCPWARIRMGSQFYTRIVRPGTWGDVKYVGIWGKDNLNP